MRLRNLFLVLIALLCLPVLAFSQDKMAPKGASKKPVIVKKMPPRAPKTGTFMKKEVVATKMAAKKMPPRDPKTGRFMRKAGGDKMTAKSGPARDPKTGRFIKKDPKAK